MMMQINTVETPRGLMAWPGARVSSEQFESWKKIVRQAGGNWHPVVRCNWVPREGTSVFLEALRSQGHEVVRMQPRRDARSPRERWAEKGLVALANLDPDGARDRNDEGFNATDTRWGRRMAQRVKFGFGLSDHEWEEAVRRLQKYHRQIGTPPEDMKKAAPHRSDRFRQEVRRG